MLGLQMAIAIGFPGEKAESLGELRRAKRQILRRDNQAVHDLLR